MLEGDDRIRAKCEAARAVRAHPLLLRQAVERGIEAHPIVCARNIAREPRARQAPLEVLARGENSGAGAPQQLGNDRSGRGAHDANADVGLSPREIRDARLGVSRGEAPVAMDRQQEAKIVPRRWPGLHARRAYPEERPGEAVHSIPAPSARSLPPRRSQSTLPRAEGALTGSGAAGPARRRRRPPSPSRSLLTSRTVAPNAG